MLKHTWCTAGKELKDYFSSSAALLFLGIFLMAVYTTFFWVETFFARNLADVRPLFDWIPVLFIFLISALTMHSWSEERRMGTIELILTSAVSPWAYLLGKFLAVLCLIVFALALTISLPLTASFLGDLDWGPVIGGYLAAVFLAAAYIAIGLWASAHTENQIVSLILSITVAGILYALGSSTFTGLLSYDAAASLRAFGSGSRFESITRGVLDLRDIFYYLTIVAVFLLLTHIKLESLRWSKNLANNSHICWYKLFAATGLFLLATNFVLSYITQARVDLTQGNIYSLSPATKRYLQTLEEPLLIRGYFSSSTHPLLAPLIPRIRDLLDEYAVQGSGNIRVEFIDPLDDPQFEEEAGGKYGIRPVSFHTESKYQASVINTYFNILVAYADQFAVLNYKNLVELKSSAGRHEVDLDNPEYKVTRTLRSVIAKANRQIDSLASLDDILVLTAYVSPADVLPQQHKTTLSALDRLAAALKHESNENFDLLYIDPDQDQLTQEYLRNELGVKPVSSDTFNTPPYWFHFTLTDGKSTVPVLIPPHGNEVTVRQSIFAAYKRLLPDSVNKVAILRPIITPGPAGVSESPGIPKHFSILRNTLQDTVQVVDIDLQEGVMPDDVDFLMVLAPRYLTPVQTRAIQDFFSSGGTVLVASSTIDANISFFTEVYQVESGLQDWLEELGVTIEDGLVLDTKHGQLSLPTGRQVGGLRIRETNVVNYPYVIDVRGEGLNTDSGITSKLGQIYVPWASPISVQDEKSKDYTVTPLLHSSANSWVSTSEEILPDFKTFPDLGFAYPDGSTESHTLATMIEGSFTGNSSEGVSSRLIVVGSGALFTDNFADQMSQVLRSEYRRPIQFMQNLVDWSLEDQTLLDVLRKHSQFTRTLTTLDEQSKTGWEYLNYTFGITGLILAGLLRLFSSKIFLRKSKRILSSA